MFGHKCCVGAWIIIEIVLELWLFNNGSKLLWTIPTVTYDLFSELQSCMHPHNHMVTFWVLRNQLTFTAICSIPQSDYHDLWLFCQFPAFAPNFQQKHPWGNCIWFTTRCFLNDCCNKNIKKTKKKSSCTFKFCHVMLRIMTATTYDWNYGSNLLLSKIKCYLY